MLLCIYQTKYGIILKNKAVTAFNNITVFNPVLYMP